MNIGIIGGGSIGMLFSHYLQRNHRVTLYCRTIEQVHKINEFGVRYRSNNGNGYTTKLTACLSEELQPEDLFIITVKQYHLKALEFVIKAIPKEVPLLFLQNGMGHLAYLEKLPHDNILVGVVEHGALKNSENEVIQSGEGRTKVALYRGSKECLEIVVDAFHYKDFPFLVESDYESMLERKLIANAVINPLTGVLHIKNGELIENPYFYQLFLHTFNEIANILNLTNREHYLQEVEVICKKTASNTSSLLKDIIERRPTEIEGILGYILKIAREKNHTAPVIHFLYHAVKGKEPKEGELNGEHIN